jgi:polyhydroxyalkanoate synthase
MRRSKPWQWFRFADPATLPTGTRPRIPMPKKSPPDTAPKSAASRARATTPRTTLSAGKSRAVKSTAAEAPTSSARAKAAGSATSSTKSEGRMSPAPAPRNGAIRNGQQAPESVATPETVAALAARESARPVAEPAPARSTPDRTPPLQPEKSTDTGASAAPGAAREKPSGDAKVPFGAAIEDFAVRDPEAFARNMLTLLEEGSKVMTGMMQRAAAPSPAKAVTELTETSKLMTEIGQRWLSDPARMAEAQTTLVKGYLDVWQGAWQRMLGETPEPVAAPEPGDNRFKDPEWTSNPYFDFWKQAYLHTSQWAEKALERTDGLDERTRHKAEFLLKQATSALSPSNFPMTNPEVVRETAATDGRNLVDGIRQLLADMERSDGVLQISQVDKTAFEVGRNLAVTPGKVVFQNDVLQLIQYTPTTERVHRVPLLIVPPWINKFYILDLTPAKSFIKYAVEQGFTVFVVSWVDPDERLAGKTFEDYMREGILAATDAVQRETRSEKINVLGYCVGGTLLASTLAWLAAKDEMPYASVTFLTTQVDFTKAGDLKLFIDEAQLENIREIMAEKGYLEGSRMATVFNMLRPRDLIWPYVVNNYLLGKKPLPFDLLYWNSDSTRMPAANHSFYLREFYHENKLAEGRMILAGRKLDLGKVNVPIYDLAAREDHIAPAKSVYIGARMFGGPVTYVMSGSGHIAGVVNPPAKPKYQYWTNERLEKDFERWVAGAEEHPGSWWPHWTGWLAGHSGSMVPARKPGARLGVIEDAPGSYVKARR